MEAVPTQVESQKTRNVPMVKSDQRRATKDERREKAGQRRIRELSRREAKVTLATTAFEFFG